jgi:hypothetical protein
MRRLICHATDCNARTSETFFHCEMHGGEGSELLLKTGEK